MKDFKLFAFIWLVLILSCHKDNTTFFNGTVVDIDSNVYQAVTIGNQVWMTENLRTTKYNDGSSIPYSIDDSSWQPGISKPAYCWYDTTGSGYKQYNKELFGALYNWHIVGTEKLCPTGWHVPTNEEWSELVTYLGGIDVAGGKLKSTGTIEGNDGLWRILNRGATDESRFSAIPSGERSDWETTGIGFTGVWWSSTEKNDSVVWCWYLLNGESSIFRQDILKRPGFSVRCIKD
jgi:uncharacterized protein (TIGR02145 family)